MDDIGPENILLLWLVTFDLYFVTVENLLLWLVTFGLFIVTVEIHAVNESCVYLMKLIHDIGLELRSSAVCSGLRRLRYGQFTLVHALLTKHCDARSIAENMDFCRRLVTWDKLNERIDVISASAAGMSGTDDSQEIPNPHFMEDLDDDILAADLETLPIGSNIKT